MQKTRLEAFSDGVFAIIITIMVLELKVPHGDTFAALRPLVPVCLSYVLSYVYVGIYWSNHHHMLSSTARVNGTILWANLHLLFWLSLIPITTAWIGESHFAPAALTLYGAVLLLADIAYWVLQARIIAQDGHGSVLAYAIGSDRKGQISPVLYVVGILASFWLPWLAGALYVLVALLWLVPDRRIERTLACQRENPDQPTPLAD